MNYLKKLAKCLHVLKYRDKYVHRATYYPDDERKTDKQILCDLLFIAHKFGVVEPFYFTYGFDRKEMTRQRMLDEYLMPYRMFQDRISYLNFNNPQYGQFHGRTLTADKFYFNIFLERFNIPTPKIYLYVKNKRPIYFSDEFTIDHSLPVEEQLKQFFSHDMDAFAKPSDGQLGNGAFSLKIKDGKPIVDFKETTMENLISIILSADYMVQNCIYQHPKMNALNPSCINSIRLQTVMDSDGVVHPFAAGLRIGRNGSSVDNWAKGGVFVGIDMSNGKLMKTGIMKPQYGTAVTEHPDTHMPFEGFEIPFYSEAVALAIKLHERLYRCHSVGWDIAITEQGPVFIEGNGWWEISLLQAVHGGLKKQIGKYFEV